MNIYKELITKDILFEYEGRVYLPQDVCRLKIGDESDVKPNEVTLVSLGKIYHKKVNKVNDFEQTIGLNNNNYDNSDEIRLQFVKEIIKDRRKRRDMIKKQRENEARYRMLKDIMYKKEIEELENMSKEELEKYMEKFKNNSNS
jgi:hypothetical protein